MVPPCSSPCKRSYEAQAEAPCAAGGLAGRAKTYRSARWPSASSTKRSASAMSPRTHTWHMTRACLPRKPRILGMCCRQARDTSALSSTGNPLPSALLAYASAQRLRRRTPWHRRRGCGCPSACGTGRTRGPCGRGTPRRPPCSCSSCSCPLSPARHSSMTALQPARHRNTTHEKKHA